MTNRAQIIAPYLVDMFTMLPAGTLATFTDDNAPAGYYKVTPDQAPAPLLIPVNEFSKYFKYYTQSQLNF